MPSSRITSSAFIKSGKVGISGWAGLDGVRSDAEAEAGRFFSVVAVMIAARVFMLRHVCVMLAICSRQRTQKKIRTIGWESDFAPIIQPILSGLARCAGLALGVEPCAFACTRPNLRPEAID